MLLQCHGSPIGQMLFIRRQQGRTAGRQDDILRGGDGDVIRQGDGLHQHVHQMIAVLPLTDNVQRPVDLRPGLQAHGDNLQSVITV